MEMSFENVYVTRRPLSDVAQYIIDTERIWHIAVRKSYLIIVQFQA